VIVGKGLGVSVGRVCDGALVTEGRIVSVGSVGGLVAMEGEEQEISRKKQQAASRIRVAVSWSMGCILTDIKS
jgi:hypothetical protein